jgi:hypothetical protein
LAGITAYFVLGEELFSLQVVGGIGVIAAIVLLQMAKEKTAPSTPIEIRQSSNPYLKNTVSPFTE